MDWVSSSKKTMELLKKYRYVLLVLLIGLFLMFLPEEKEAEQAQSVAAPQTEQKDLQTELEELLSQMEGAGKVKVLLTQSAGERKVYQTNDDTDTAENSGSIRRDTVVITNSDRAEDGLVQQTLPPVYLGAVVLCQGADSASVRLAIMQAVSSATGLASHNISVLKMK